MDPINPYLLAIVPRGTTLYIFADNFICNKFWVLCFRDF